MPILYTRENNGFLYSVRCDKCDKKSEWSFMFRSMILPEMAKLGWLTKCSLICPECRRKHRECPVCCNEDIRAEDKYCKICGVKLEKGGHYESS